MGLKKWSPEKIEQLRALAQAGKSTVEAAIELQCSKGAVIGQAQRAKPPVQWQHGPRWPKSEKQARPRFPDAPRLGRPPKHLVDLNIGVGEPKPLMLKFFELAPNNCHWPYGAGPYLFCGTGTYEGHEYCPYHTRKLRKTVK
jgi:hypothetical protein